jgi:hypothetical protein
VSPTAASSLATGLAFVWVALFSVWYVVPWMRRHPATVALAACLWVHALRIVALQIFSARAAGFHVSLGTAREIAYGDVAAGCLAVVGVWLLRRRSRAVVPFLWLFIAVAAADLVNATILGVRENATDTATDLTWLILSVYVPVLWAALALAVWQLATRRRELSALTGEARPTRAERVRPSGLGSPQ